MADVDLLVKIDNLMYNLYDLSKMELVKFCKEIVPEFITANISYTMSHEKVKSRAGKIKQELDVLSPSEKILNGIAARDHEKQ
jgi:hypothetical protein